MQDAQAAGFAVDTGQSSTASGGVTLGTAQAAVPTFTGAAPTNLTSGYTNTSLYTQGSANIVACDQAGYVSGGNQASAECNASVTVQGNTNYQAFSASDPILKIQPNTTALNAALGSGTSSETCSPVVTTTPEVAQQKTCNDFLQTYTSTCSRGLNDADFGLQAQPYSVNQGSEVPPWSVRTFNLSMNIVGTPSNFILQRYQIDNYGQVWVNGVLVYQNVLGGMGDMRNGYINSIYFVNANGGSIFFYDDGCNWGCRGVNPNLDITPYIHSGQNQITLVCANANGIGPCAIDIQGQAYVFLGTYTLNSCKAQQSFK